MGDTQSTNLSNLNDIDQLITEKQVGDFLGLTIQCLQSWRQQGEGPPFIRISPRCIRYRRSDIDAWLKRRLCYPTSDQSFVQEKDRGVI